MLRKLVMTHKNGTIEDFNKSAISKISYLEKVRAPRTKTTLKESVDEVVTFYKEAKTKKGIYGIRTLWHELDITTGGCLPGDLITVAARPGVGKTFVLCALAECMFSAGKKVLFITEEMTPQAIIRRVSCLNAKVSPKKFKRGGLNSEETLRLSKSMKLFKENGDRFIISGSTYNEEEASGLLPIIAKIQEEKPDVVFIDGAYLLTDSSSKLQEWQLFLKLTRKIKKIALSENVPIIISSQINREGEVTTKKKKPALKDLAFGDTLGQDSDVVLFLIRMDTHEIAKEALLAVVKARESEKINLDINFDIDESNFSFIGESAI